MNTTKGETMSIDIKTVLALHLKWICGEEGGARANLREADLREANLREANLRGADLRGADLCEANLRGADLRWANLRGADLREADLCGADLREADLCEANLREANLRGADLCEANLRGADLREANLRWANLRGADLLGTKDGAVCRMDFGGWSICVRAIKTSIGCQTHDNKKWLNWSPDDVAEMHENAKEWWIVHGDAVKAAINCVMQKAEMERRPE